MLVIDRKKTIKVLKAHGMKLNDFKDFLKMIEILPTL